MLMRLSQIPAVALVLGLASASPAAPPRPPVAEVVKKMQSFYNDAQDLKGKFKQVYTDSLYNREKVAYGYLYVKKPGMMRWNYVKPERKAFIADGKQLWVWEPDDQQAFRNPLSTDTLSTGLAFLLGKGDLSKEFNISYSDGKQLGGPGDVVLKLTPKQPTGQYEHLLFAVNLQDHAVGESMVVGKHNNNHFVFTNLQINTKISGARFRFHPPTGTRVIDGSKIGSKVKP